MQRENQVFDCRGDDVFGIEFLHQVPQQDREETQEIAVGLSRKAPFRSVPQLRQLTDPASFFARSESDGSALLTGSISVLPDALVCRGSGLMSTHRFARQSDHVLATPMYYNACSRQIVANDHYQHT